MGPLLVGVGVGLGLAIWTARPVMVEQHSGGFVLLLVLVVVCAWVGGQRRAAASAAVAIAQARATARASSRSGAAAVAGVNVYVGDGATRTVPRDALMDAEWRGDRDEVAESTLELVERADGGELDQLIEDGDVVDLDRYR